MIEEFNTTCPLQSLHSCHTHTKQGRPAPTPSPFDLWHLDYNRICEVNLVYWRSTLTPLWSQVLSVKRLLIISLVK